MNRRRNSRVLLLIYACVVAVVILAIGISSLFSRMKSIEWQAHDVRILGDELLIEVTREEQISFHHPFDWGRAETWSRTRDVWLLAYDVGKAANGSRVEPAKIGGGWHFEKRGRVQKGLELPANGSTKYASSDRALIRLQDGVQVVDLSSKGTAKVLASIDIPSPKSSLHPQAWVETRTTSHLAIVENGLRVYDAASLKLVPHHLPAGVFKETHDAMWQHGGKWFLSTDLKYLVAAPNISDWHNDQFSFFDLEAGSVGYRQLQVAGKQITSIRDFESLDGEPQLLVEMKDQCLAVLDGQSNLIQDLGKQDARTRWDPMAGRIVQCEWRFGEHSAITEMKVVVRDYHQNLARRLRLHIPPLL